VESIYQNLGVDLDLWFYRGKSKIYSSQMTEPEIYELNEDWSHTTETTIHIMIKYNLRLPFVLFKRYFNIYIFY